MKAENKKGRLMKGHRIVVETKQSLRCEEFDIQGTVPSGHILVKNHYSLISPGTELSGYIMGAPHEYYPGYTSVGDVIQVGEGSDAGLIGKTVFLFPSRGDSHHCHATHKIFSTEGLAVGIPSELDMRKACFARIVNIGLTPYCNAGVKTMDSVLVIGLGLVGNIVGQIGKKRGLLSIGADIDESRRKRALDVGFDAVIDPAKEDIVSVVNKLTEGRGSDLSINATGATQLFIPAIKATAQGGEVSTLGGSKQSLTTDIKEIFSIIHSRHITIRGGWELQLPMRAAPAIPIPSIEDNLRNAFRWLANGSLKIDPIWTHTISPGEFKTAYDALSHKNPAYFGVIVAWKV